MKQVQTNLSVLHFLKQTFSRIRPSANSEIDNTS